MEIFHRGVWGTVCDDNWDELAAEVVCHQLGFSGVKPGGALINFGQGNRTGTSAGSAVRTCDVKVLSVVPGTGGIWLDDVRCSGLEEELSNCRFTGWGIHNCNHNEDVGIRCLSGTLTQICAPTREALTANAFTFLLYRRSNKGRA